MQGARILGAHQSISGGYHRAVQRAQAAGCQCVQVFTRNSNQWRAKPITPQEGEAFRAALTNCQINHPLAHDSYLINLASPDDALWRRSLDAFVMELERAHALGIPYVVTHPGAHTTASESEGIRRVIDALDEVHQRTSQLAAQCLLETTAGQGTCLGWRFEHLAAILAGVRQPERLGVCFDTCHVFAAGYDLGKRSAYRATMREFDRLIGLDRIRAFHLNDSQRELGSRVDRHAHIGQGQIGLDAFRHLLNDPRFAAIPMYLETPKKQEGEQDMDAVNLGVLRGLLGRKAPRG